MNFIKKIGPCEVECERVWAALHYSGMTKIPELGGREYSIDQYPAYTKLHALSLRQYTRSIVLMR